MNELFISYSRKDKPFVQKLDAALRAGGRDPWVDWEDIPLTADWWAEIQTGIEGADTFIFIISPDSAASQVCNQELDHATLHHKRIVPVVYREVKDVPHKLTHLNWVFCRESDDFESAFKALLETMQTDLDWVKAHTRLTQRVVEWDRRNRNDSFTLRGDDLTDAERMLTQTEKKPKLTELQGQYILASRRSAARRQRQILGAVVIGLVVAVVLAIVAFVAFYDAEQQRQLANQAQATAEAQRQLADQHRLEAERERDLAYARELLANAQINLGVDPELSALLALQAMSVADDAPSRNDMPEARTLLQEAVQSLNVQMTLFDEVGAGFSTIAFSPDGAQLVTGNQSGEVKVWDAASGEEIWANTPEAPVTDVAFSPDGTRLAAAGEDNTVRVWDAASGQELLPISSDALVLKATFNREDMFLMATFGADGTARVWAADSGEMVFTFNDVADVAFSPDRPRLATADGDGKITIWDAMSREKLNSFEVESPVNDLVFSPDGTRLATANRDKKARLFEAASGRLLQTLIGHTVGWVYSAAFSPDGRLLATVGDDRALRIWETQSGELLLTLFGHTGSVERVTFSPDGVHLATASVDGTVKVWRPTGDILTGHADWVTDAIFSPDGKYLATLSFYDEIAKVWNVPSSGEVMPLGSFVDAQNMEFSPDGGDLAILTAEAVEVWDLAAGKLLLSLPNDGLGNVLFSPDGTRLVTGDSQIVRVWNLTPGEELFNIPFDHSAVDSVVFSPDGASILTAGNDGGVQAWDGTSGSELFNTAFDNVSGQPVTLSPGGDYVATLDDSLLHLWNVTSSEEVWALNHDGEVIDVFFSPDSVRLAVGVGNKQIQLWDIRSGQKLSLLNHIGPVKSVAFSSDGKYLATGSGRDGMTTVWDVQSGTKLLTLSGHINAINAVVFSPDGVRLVTASDDGTARLHILDSNELLEAAYSRLSRWWTPEECQQYLQQAECPPDLRPKNTN